VERLKPHLAHTRRTDLSAAKNGGRRNQSLAFSLRNGMIFFAVNSRKGVSIMVLVREANLYDESDSQSIVFVLDAYSADPNGLGRPLADDVKRALPYQLARLPNCKVFVAILEERIVGAAICFIGFSTFNAQEVVNIHDLAVLPEFRNRGIGSVLLNAVDDFARQLGACKITLEVRENNKAAERLYIRKGFQNPFGDCERSFFMERRIVPPEPLDDLC
jgi:ribosomal protein S18 acetylase RimI-like enzyme